MPYASPFPHAGPEPAAPAADEGPGAFTSADSPGVRPLTPAEQATLDRLTRLAVLLDARFRIPGVGVRVGLDGILGLVPVVGDTAALLLSAYIIREAQKLGISRATTARMIANVALDYLAGGVPLLGDLFDIAFKANLRNLRLLGIDPRTPGTPRNTPHAGPEKPASAGAEGGCLEGSGS